MTIDNDPYVYLPPDLSEFPATDREKAVAAEYTLIQRVQDDDFPTTHAAWLKVGVQSFKVAETFDDAPEASWMCWMLAKALIRVIDGAKS
jgi:hypothetical protein